MLLFHSTEQCFVAFLPVELYLAFSVFVAPWVSQTGHVWGWHQGSASWAVVALCRGQGRAQELLLCCVCPQGPVPGWHCQGCVFSLFPQCRLAVKSQNRDGWKLAYIKAITEGLKESTIMEKTVFRDNLFLMLLRKGMKRIILWTTPEIRWQLEKRAARKGGIINFKLGLYL